MMADLSENQFQLVDAAGAATPHSMPRSKRMRASFDLRDLLAHTTLTGSDGVVMPFSKLLMAKELELNQIIGISVSGDVVTVYYQ